MNITKNVKPSEQAAKDNERAAKMKAAQNIASGEYFAVDGTTYQAEEAIVRGEAIVPGTNCTEVAITDIINALNDSGKEG